jgi:2-iminoacetate synthase
MTICTVHDLQTLRDWIRASDQHAEHHLRLLSEAEGLLQSIEQAGSEAAVVLADKLERWRYQHLNECGLSRTPRDEALVDALDVASRQLAGRGFAEARRTRHAVRDTSLDSEAIEQAAAMLDPAFPLEELVQRARRLTCEHFPASDDPRAVRLGRRRMMLYAPLYVSSHCVNYCTYCGFRYPLDISRKHLTVDESCQQARILQRRGFEHLLVVGGDFPSRTTALYYQNILAALVEMGIQPAIEIAAQSTRDYGRLVEAGACGVTLYQETYDEHLYAGYHLRGPKASYHWRLEALDRAAEAGIRRLGLGILLGLADPRDDLQAMMRHAAYLGDRHRECKLAFSLPRIHDAPDDFQIPYTVSDDQLVRYYAVLRCAFPQAVLVLSTRESAELRNRLARICITQMSAGSSTAPGGYQADQAGVGEQFPVADERPPAEVAQWLRHQGFQVCWSTKCG